jgi:hypothetical protein
VFGRALLCPRAALLQNSRVEQLCSGVFVVFGKIGVHSSRKEVFECGKTFLPLFIECMFVEHDEAYVIVFAVNSSKEIEIFAHDTEK